MKLKDVFSAKIHFLGSQTYYVQLRSVCVVVSWLKMMYYSGCVNNKCLED